MDVPNHLCGAFYDPDKTEATCIALASAGKEPLFADAAPQFAGFGKGKCILLQDAEEKLFGKTLPSWTQTRGICVSDGTGRASQDSYNWALAFGDLIGKPVQFCPEVIYGGARMTIRKGEMGKASPWGTPSNKVRGDGAYACDAALFVHNYGYLARGKYDLIDLTTFREDLAIQWGNVGVPATLLAESASYKARACMKATSIENVRDGIAAGYAATCSGAFCTQGQRSPDGMISMSDSGGHCEEICGVFEDLKGRLCFVIQNSWGSQGPQGGGAWKLTNGREVMPREGAAAVFSDTIQTYLRTGEIWLFAPPANAWASTQKPGDFA